MFSKSKPSPETAPVAATQGRNSVRGGGHTFSVIASDVEITTGEKYFVVWRAEDIGRPALSAIRDWAIAEFIHA